MAKIKSIFIFFICCIIFFQTSLGQPAASSFPRVLLERSVIKGSVINTNGQPVTGIWVGIKNTDEADRTNAEGRYILSRVDPGKATLIVTGPGIAMQQKNIVLTGGKTETINFVVTDTTHHHLKAVTITYSRNKFATGKSDYVAGMPLPNLENPQAYTVIPQGVMREQMAISYTDAFKNIPGTELPDVANNGRVDISSRGFKVRSQIVDGVSGYTMTNIDPANIEKIEVIRGPSATLFGSSLTSYGGLVNIVTKQPYDQTGGNISYTAGSFRLNRLTADVNTPLNKKHTLLFRINGAGQTGGSYYDAGFQKSIFAAPSLTYKLNERVTLKADADYYTLRATSPFWFIPSAKTTVFDVRDLDLNKKLLFSGNDIYYNARQFDLRVRADVKLGKTWISHTTFSRTDNHLDGFMLSLKGITDSTLIHNVSTGPQYFSTMEVQQNFLHDRTYGTFRNRLLLGLDFYHYKTKASTATFNADTLDFIHPGKEYHTFTREEADEILATTAYKNTGAVQNTYSVYFSDVASIHDRWFVMASLRFNQFENHGAYDPSSGKIKGQYSQGALSPKVGFVYQPLPGKVSVYLNYMNGFENVNGTDFEGNAFKPQQANQWEGGTKLALFNGKITGTLSVYNIHVTNILRDDPSHQNYSIQDGTELSRGIEFSTAANPFSGLNIMAGYAYNYCTYLKADDGLQGRRPDGAGPQNTANVWISYKIRTGKVKGLGIGAGGRYGSNLVTIKSFTPVFYVPGYTVLDATVFYQHSFYRIGLKVNNLTNETYWNNRLQWQSPRSLDANIILSF